MRGGICSRLPWKQPASVNKERPDVEERLSPEALWNAEDNQLARARRAFAELGTSLATA
jgi:hypothetical protein